MLHKTSGIILHTIPYSEKNLIVKIYTQNFGLQSYLITGTRNKKSGNKAQLFQPLAIVDLVVSNSEKNKLNRISELSISYHYLDLSTNIYKSSIAQFINEILYKSLKEEHADSELFDFIASSLQILDLKQDQYSNFHLSFLIQFSKYLGFFPEGKFSLSTPFFNLVEGKFSIRPITHEYFCSEEMSELLSLFLSLNYERLGEIKLNNIVRNKLLNNLLLFYQLHINNFGEIKSLDIIREVLN